MSHLSKVKLLNCLFQFSVMLTKGPTLMEVKLLVFSFANISVMDGYTHIHRLKTLGVETDSL